MAYEMLVRNCCLKTHQRVFKGLVKISQKWLWNAELTEGLDAASQQRRITQKDF